MASENSSFRAASEIGKIYNSILDKKALCEYFLESASSLIQSSRAFLFLRDAQGGFALECSLLPGDTPAKSSSADVAKAMQDAKPFCQNGSLFLPLIVRNNAIGAACFLRDTKAPPFAPSDIDSALDLTSQVSSALKNIILHEENLQMERLAAIGQTASMVIHEIKNIISLVTLAEGVIRQNLDREDITAARRSTDRLARCVRQMTGFAYDMLSLTKQHVPKIEKVQLAPLLEELKEDLAEKAQSLRVRLDFSPDPSLPEVQSDRDSLYRVLLNLVKNAMEVCSRDDSLVCVRTKRRDQTTYEIQVEDNGSGMTEEQKKNLFQPFYTTKGSKGTGLGLLIVSQTCKKLNGKIQVESELGKGTVFTLTMPLSPQAGTA